jgi:hypothetical protein
VIINTYSVAIHHIPTLFFPGELGRVVSCR